MSERRRSARPRSARPRSARPRSGRTVRFGLVAAAVLLGACSGGEADAPATSLSFGPQACEPADPVLVVDQIGEAVAALEADLGGPQLYFEINATPGLVNLFVADLEAESVTPYVYVAGELSSQDAIEGAAGFAFEAAAIDIEPRSVLSCVSEQLPVSVIDVFFVEGGPGGAVRYTVLTSNDQGGQLSVEVTGQGQVLSVDTV